mgnify:CR=1 FL=1
MALEFKDYRDLPFPTVVQDLLMKYHRHGEDDNIIYDEKDVIDMLKVMQAKLDDANSYISSVSSHTFEGGFDDFEPTKE